MAAGLIIAAPASGSGKTVFTLGLLRALHRDGARVASAKVGPDYIDPAFHSAASGRPCLNLDSWAMRPSVLADAAGSLAAVADLIICEGVMGLFDGADVDPSSPDGSTAEIAALTGWPVVLLVDLRGMAASSAALIGGFRRQRADIELAGIVFNRVASPTHRAMVERACARAHPDLPLLGWIPRDSRLHLPERHLGLVQAGETASLEARLEAAATVIAESVSLSGLAALARPGRLQSAARRPPLPPLGQRIAIARDDAFAFTYEGVLQGWRDEGAEISFFSPLADQPPAADADAIFLPGGYPELHAGCLAAAASFIGGLRRSAAAGAWIFGECGGYMVLGDYVQDADGTSHAMAGLLPVTTSFARRSLVVGYRRVRLADASPFGAAGTFCRGHEFHYASIISEGKDDPLFAVTDAAGRVRPDGGHRRGKILGSFIHLIDREIAG